MTNALKGLVDLAITLYHYPKDQVLKASRQEILDITKKKIRESIYTLVRGIPDIELADANWVKNFSESVFQKFLVSFDPDQDATILMDAFAQYMDEDDLDDFDPIIEQLSMMNQACRDLFNITEEKWEKLKKEHPKLATPLTPELEKLVKLEKLQNQMDRIRNKIHERKREAVRNGTRADIERLSTALKLNSAMFKELSGEPKIKDTTKDIISWTEGDVKSNTEFEKGNNKWESLRQPFSSDVAYQAFAKTGGISAVLNNIPERERGRAILTLDESNMSVLHYAVDQPKDLSTLLSYVNRMNIIPAITQLDVNSRSVLHHAAASNPQSLNLLLDEFGEAELALTEAVNQVDINGMTVLHHAANNLAAFEGLFNVYSSENQLTAILKTDNNGMSVLHHAASDAQSLDFLLAKIDDKLKLSVLTKPDVNGMSVLDYAVNNSECLEAAVQLLNSRDQAAAIKFLTERNSVVTEKSFVTVKPQTQQLKSILKQNTQTYADKYDQKSSEVKDTVGKENSHNRNNNDDDNTPGIK